MREHHGSAARTRAHALQRYMRALETGDGEALSAVLGQAQDDPVLERLILALHEVYLDADEIAIHPDEVAQAREMLQVRAPEHGRYQIGVRYADTAMLLGGRERAREIRIQEMQMDDEIPETTRADVVEMSNGAESGTHSPLTAQAQSGNRLVATRHSRAVVFLQAIAAAVVVAVMVGSFYMLFSTHLVQRGNGIGSTGGGRGGVSRTGVTLASGEGVVLVGSRDSDVLALRARDGALVWRYATGTDYPITALATLDGVVFSNTENGDVAAVRIADGKVLWNRDFNQFLGFPNMIHAEEGVLIVPLPLGPVALRASDGATVWRNTSDRFVAAGDGAVYVSSNETGTPTSIPTGAAQTHHVKALRISDGTLLWSSTLRRGGEDASLAYAANGAVYLTTSYTTGNAGGVAVTALRASDGTLIWSQTKDDMGLPFFASGQKVFTRTDTGICSYRADSGVKQWCTPTPGLDRAFTADGNGVYVCRYEGTGSKAVLAAAVLNEGNGSQHWNWRSEPQRPLTSVNNRYGASIGDVGPSVAVLDGGVYVGATEGVYGIHGSDGHQLWHALDSDSVMTLLATQAG